MVNRLFRLMLGLFLYALGITLTIKANIGFAPWDVFHVGLADTINVTIGIASIYAAFGIIAITLIMGEKLGLGTVLNMFAIGLFIDLIMYLNLVPVGGNFIISLIMLLTGLLIIAIASYYYIGSGFGAGPRDSLMVGLNRKTKLPIGLCRGIIEFLAVIVGWRLGGQVGIGTIIAALAIGPIVQYTFKLLNFDTTKIEHETLTKTWRALRANK
jgi:uncharacterized membrane protein YczE